MLLNHLIRAGTRCAAQRTSSVSCTATGPRCLAECPVYESIRSNFEHALRMQDRDMCTVMREAPQATLASYLNELWCHRTKVLSRRSGPRVEIDA